MAALATTDDLSAGWRILSSAEEDRAEALLDRASAIVRLAYPGVDDRMTASDDYTTVVVGVVSDMVMRSMLNPTGITSTTRSIDDATFTDRFDNAQGGLFLTDGELNALLETPTRVKGRAKSYYLATD